MRAIYAGALLVGLTVAGCSRSSDNESLRQGLEEMRQDSAATDPPQSEALPDTVGFGGLAVEVDTIAPDPPAAPATTGSPAPDSTRPGMQVPEPRDVRPWIPEERVRVDVPPPPASMRTAKRGEGHPVVLRKVRVARNEGFDRTVFEFQGERLPGYEIEYVDRPVRQCGSGDVVSVAGDGWLMVRLQPAHAHDEQGRSTIGPRTIRPDLPVLEELRLICDFEAEVAWVLGVSSPNRYRVLELTNPARLVVDVYH